MVRTALAITLALLAVQDPESYDALKAMSVAEAETAGRQALFRALEVEIASAWKGMDEGKLDEFERRVRRGAQLARPYSEGYAGRLVGLVLSFRREARAEGVALTLAVADDLRRRVPGDAQVRIAEARKSALLGRNFAAELDRLAAWVTTPPQQPTIDAEVLRWKSARPASAGEPCSSCKGGEVDCPGCTTGLVLQSCRPCGGRGNVSCTLCGGKGALAHGGYVGQLRVVLEKDATIKVVLRNGKNAQMRLHAQTILWSLGPCQGGSIRLEAQSTPVNPSVPPRSESVTLACPDFYDQLERFVFNGRAKIYMGTDPAGSRPLTAEAARRTFGEYDKCKDGTVPCSQCKKALQVPCAPCGAKGVRLAPCSECGGHEVKVCGTCRMSGDSAWLAAKVPADRLPDLPHYLAKHGQGLETWLRDRSKQVALREQLRVRLQQAQAGLDPKAKVEADYVALTCPVCRGVGGTCSECWGTGRREYTEGTPEFVRYQAANRLRQQLADLGAVSAGVRPPPLSLGSPAPVPAPGPTPEPAPTPTPRQDPTAGGLPPPSPVPPPGSDPPAPAAGVGSGIGGTLLDLPADLREKLKSADAAHEAGKKHLETSKASMDKPDVWASEAKKALERFREAQTLYAGVQETLDLRGLDVPKELLEKFRTNMQALVMARKQAP